MYFEYPQILTVLVLLLVLVLVLVDLLVVRVVVRKLRLNSPNVEKFAPIFRPKADLASGVKI